VLVADDHPVYRQGLINAVEERAELVLAGEADSGKSALKAIRELKPDVAVLDMKMPDLDGLEVLRSVALDGSSTKVLFLSGFLESGTVYGAIEAGARGYISKDSRAERICEAIAAVADGQMVFGPETQDAIGSEIRLRAPAPPNPLTEREREILSLTADGHSAVEIGGRLFLSPATVKTHLQRIYQKLEVSDRAAAVAEGMRRGMFQ
jgi:two-component system nitrate/nitrite response regulator NarL